MLSKHADLLNALNDMQQSIVYAARRPVLAKAESLIAAQEKEIENLKREQKELLRSAGISTCGHGLTATND